NDHRAEVERTGLGRNLDAQPVRRTLVGAGQIHPGRGLTGLRHPQRARAAAYGRLDMPDLRALGACTNRSLRLGTQRHRTDLAKQTLRQLDLLDRLELAIGLATLDGHRKRGCRTGHRACGPSGELGLELLGRVTSLVDLERSLDRDRRIAG